MKALYPRLLMVGLLLISNVALADLKKTSVETSIPLKSDVVEQARASNDGALRDNKKRGGKSLRCWQNGRLLYETDGIRAVSGRGARGDGAYAVTTAEGEITLIDMQQGVCIVSN